MKAPGTDLGRLLMVAGLFGVLAATMLAPAAGADPGVATDLAPAVPVPAKGVTIPGPAGPDSPSVDIDITTFEPATPQPGDRLVIEGTVTNVTEAALVNVQALLRHNLNPISSRADLEFVDTDPRLMWGSRPGHVFAEVSRSLAAGESAAFRLEARLETACPPATPGELPCVQIQHPGVYVFGVDIREGNPNVPGARVDAGTTLTLLPWHIGAAEHSVKVALLWPVSAAPALQADGKLGEIDANAMLGPGGWLNTLLDAPGDAPVTWVVNPDVLDTVGAIAAGDDQAANLAVDWLRTFESIANRSPTWLLPFAVPDVASFAPSEQADLAAAAVRLSTIAAQELPTGTRTVAWPVSAAALERELASYRAAGLTTAVVPSDAVAGESGPWVDLPAGNGEISGLVVDTALSSTIAVAEDDVAMRQRWLSETAIAVLEHSAGEPAPLVVSPPLSWQPSHQAAARLIEVWMSAPWVEPVAVDQIGSQRAPGTLVSAAAPTSEPDSPTADAAAELLADVSQYETLLAEPSDGEDFGAVTVRAASATWRADPDAGRHFVAASTAAVRDLLAQVSAQVAPTVTLSSNTGAFPVNVVNHLDVPVTVRLDLESANPQRMAVEPITAQRIEPGETDILRVTAEAVANGKVRVDLQLATVDGTPLGRATHTVVNATDYGVIGWFLIVGAGLLFVAGLALRTIRGKRRNGTPDLQGNQLSDHAPLEGASR
ncbi:MAG TPA: DUF6049 family protein [Jiangellales bacterium]|nr:DUF6049 family protein [Jiangellales bacterium]